MNRSLLKKFIFLTDEQLLTEYRVAYHTYFSLTKSSDISTFDSIAQFGNAKEMVKLISRELNKRGIRFNQIQLV